MFDIQEEMRVVVSADIPSFDNERMEINSDSWSAVNAELSILWITTHTKETSDTSSDEDSDEDEAPISESDPDARTIICHLNNSEGKSLILNEISASPTTIFVHKNADMDWLKHAICLKKPELCVQGLHLETGQFKESASVYYEHTSDCRLRKTTYYFTYDPLCCAEE